MSIVVQYSIHFMVPCIQTLLLNSTLFIMWWRFSPGILYLSCCGDSAPAYYNFVLWQFSHGLLLFWTVANSLIKCLYYSFLYFYSRLGCYYISLPSLNNYQVVAIQPQHTITFCIVSNSLKYLILSTSLYLFMNDWVVIVFMPSLNKFGPFNCIWMPSTFVLLFKRFFRIF